LICLVFPATSQAELRVIGVLVTKDKQSTTRVSIYSDVKEEIKSNVSVKDAIPVLRDAKGWGSSVKVGLVVRDVQPADYLPLITEISKNSELELAFLEGEKPDFIHDNIRKLIVAANGHLKDSAVATANDTDKRAEPKNAPELPVGRFLKSK
jgi:hypothetical protein